MIQSHFIEDCPKWNLIFIKREMYDGRKYPRDKNLTYFWVEFTFYFSPISNISLFLKTTKMYIFPTYSPKRNLQSNILRRYLKNSANKICDIM